jgi:PAS domain S-box-containing protein
MTETRRHPRSKRQHADQPADASVDSLYRLLIDRVIDYAIFALDPRGQVISWNSGAERMKGYGAAHIIGQHFSVFYTPEDQAAQKPASLLQLAEREGRVEDEGWRVRSDGSRFWADVIITALRDEDGKLVGFAKVTRDLTARRASETQIRRRVAAEAAQAEAERRSAEREELNQ